jgi:hypothetical protein
VLIDTKALSSRHGMTAFQTGIQIAEEKVQGFPAQEAP